MKKTLIAAAAVASLLAASEVQANTVKGAAIGAVGGAVVAGPPGLVIGGVAGAVIGSKHHRRHRVARAHHRSARRHAVARSTAHAPAAPAAVPYRTTP